MFEESGHNPQILGRRDLCRDIPKKVYLNLPVNDSLMIGYFSKMGYKIEGLLQAPYTPGLDLVQMGKLI